MCMFGDSGAGYPFDYQNGPNLLPPAISHLYQYIQNMEAIRSGLFKLLCSQRNVCGRGRCKDA